MFTLDLVIEGCCKERNLHHFLKALVTGHKMEMMLASGDWSLSVMNGHSRIFDENNLFGWFPPQNPSNHRSSFFYFMSCGIVKSLSHPFSSTL